MWPELFLAFRESIKEGKERKMFSGIRLSIEEWFRKVKKRCGFNQVSVFAHPSRAGAEFQEEEKGGGGKTELTVERSKAFKNRKWFVFNYITTCMAGLRNVGLDRAFRGLKINNYEKDKKPTAPRLHKAGRSLHDRETGIAWNGSPNWVAGRPALSK